MTLAASVRFVNLLASWDSRRAGAWESRGNGPLNSRGHGMPVDTIQSRSLAIQATSHPTFSCIVNHLKPLPECKECFFDLDCYTDGCR
jgi:hypothetical protein